LLAIPVGLLLKGFFLDVFPEEYGKLLCACSWKLFYEGAFCDYCKFETYAEAVNYPG